MKFQIPVGRFNYVLQKNAPKILMVLGGAFGVGAVVAACKATPKAQDILVETKEELDKIDEVAGKTTEEYPVYNSSDAAKDKAIVKSKAALKIAKAYGPTIALEAASLGCFFGSHHILNKRNAALSAASLITEQAFKDYRARVAERFGEEVDKELRYKMVDKEYTEEVTDSKGKVKTVTKTKKVSEYDGLSEFDRWFVGGFDDGRPDCVGWEKYPEYNKDYLIQRQAWANRDLKKYGFLQLSDVYGYLGYLKTKASSSAGWIYDPNKGENQISFGIDDPYRNSEFINGESPNCYLHFNITTTNIWDYIEPTKEDIAHISGRWK